MVSGFIIQQNKWEILVCSYITEGLIEPSKVVDASLAMYQTFYNYINNSVHTTHMV